MEQLEGKYSQILDDVQKSLEQANIQALNVTMRIVENTLQFLQRQTEELETPSTTATRCLTDLRSNPLHRPKTQ